MAFKTFRFPLAVDRSQGNFELTETTLETIKQNLLLFFVTDTGERVVNNQLGSIFRKSLFEPSKELIEFKIDNEINRIFSTYFTNLKLLSSKIEVIENTNTTQNAVKISILYSVNNLETMQDKIDVIIG